MVTKRLTYTDFNGKERTEDFYFHMSEVDLVKMDAKYPGGMQGFIQRMIDTEDKKKLIELAEEIIKLSYGEKSPDGKYFNKSEELTEAFTHTQAYVDLFMELATDAEKAADFINNVVPPRVLAAAKNAQQNGSAEVVELPKQ